MPGLCSMLALACTLTSEAPAAPIPPPPENASGIARKEKRVRIGYRTLRGILYLPRRIVDLVVAPVRVGLWAYDRFQLARLYRRVFTFDGRGDGIFPLFRFESGFGASMGARVLRSDLFRNGGKLEAYGTYGGRFGRQIGLDADSGWIGRRRVRLGVQAAYRYVPADRFFGIGDGDAQDAPDIDRKLDPRRENIAVATRFEHESAIAGGIATLRLVEPLHAEVSSTLSWRRFGPATRGTNDPDTAEVFAPDRLVGYDRGLLNVYTQMRLLVDTRHADRLPPLPTAGWLVSLHLGVQAGVREDPSRFARAGIDAQRFIQLWAAHRILRLRVAVDTAIGPYDRIPFVDLPSLGGPYFLRGYPRARFRDRIAAFGTVEYVWEIDDFMAGFLFVDPGRVWSGRHDVAPFRFRLGYGGGVQIHNYRSFIARIQIASSLDGGVFVNVNFSPGSRPWLPR